MEPKEILIRSNNQIRAVPADDSYYIEHEKIEYYDKISGLEEQLKPDFFRIHKGYLINLKYVQQYHRTEVSMQNGDILPISKYKYQNFVKAYQEYCSGTEECF